MILGQGAEVSLESQVRGWGWGWGCMSEWGEGEFVNSVAVVECRYKPIFTVQYRSDKFVRYHIFKAASIHRYGFPVIPFRALLLWRLLNPNRSSIVGWVDAMGDVLCLYAVVLIYSCAYTQFCLHAVVLICSCAYTQLCLYAVVLTLSFSLCAGVLVARQVPPAQAQVLQPRSHGLRVEQVQPNALRPRQPPPQDRARLQVQHLFSGLDR